MSCPFTNPGVGEFKQWYDRDFPFSAQGVNATAMATFNAAGQILAVVPVDLGSGYTSAARVQIVDADNGPGTGATATSGYFAGNNGQITSYTLGAAGAGYLNPQVLVTGGGVDDTNKNYVRDTDINAALSMAGINMNPSLWPDQDGWNIAYLLKAAHFLCIRIRGSTQGLRGRGGEWLRAAFGAGEINASFNFPAKITRSTNLAPLMETTYGCQYLQLVAPQLIANVRGVVGHTKP
jgi:hypothetical protein